MTGENGTDTVRVINESVKVAGQQMGRFCVQKLACILLQKHDFIVKMNTL